MMMQVNPITVNVAMCITHCIVISLSTSCADTVLQKNVFDLGNKVQVSKACMAFLP